AAGIELGAAQVAYSRPGAPLAGAGHLPGALGEARAQKQSQGAKGHVNFSGGDRAFLRDGVALSFFLTVDQPVRRAFSAVSGGCVTEAPGPCLAVHRG